MSLPKQKERAIARLIAIGVAWDKAHGFDIRPEQRPPAKKRPKQRIYKTGITAAIREGANSIMRRQEPVKPMRCVPADGNFAKYLERLAA